MDSSLLQAGRQPFGSKARVVISVWGIIMENPQEPSFSEAKLNLPRLSVSWFCISLFLIRPPHVLLQAPWNVLNVCAWACVCGKQGVELMSVWAAYTSSLKMSLEAVFYSCSLFLGGHTAKDILYFELKFILKRRYIKEIPCYRKVVESSEFQYV